MEDEQSGSTGAFSEDRGIPEYIMITYIVLVYQFACTALMIGMGSLVISTILKTRSLHNVHNVLIVNLMVSDIVGLIVYTFQTTGMMLSYIIGIQDPFRCDVFNFFLFPGILSLCTLVMLSVEKFIAIKYTLRYKAIVTPRRVCQVIAGGWITAVLFRFTRLVYELIAGIEYDKYSQFGICSIEPSYAFLNLFTTIIPLFLACSIATTLDIYLSIKAYQLYKKFQGNNGEGLQTQKEKNKRSQHLKPIITLLITILGTIAITVIACIIYVSTLMMENTSYQMFVQYVMIPNCYHISVVLHSLVYGLYFSEIRHSLCRRVKRMVRCCKLKRKVNSILPR